MVGRKSPNKTYQVLAVMGPEVDLASAELVDVPLLPVTSVVTVGDDGVIGLGADVLAVVGPESLPAHVGVVGGVGFVRGRVCCWCGGEQEMTRRLAFV